MKIDLAALVRATGLKADRITMQAIDPTQAQEKDLARLYVAVVRVWANGARDRILPAYKRSLVQQRASDSLTLDRAGDVEVEIESVDREAVRSIFTFRGLLQAWSDAFQSWHMNKVISQLTYATNVDLRTQMRAGDVQETVEDVVARNVALVRNVSDQTRGRIADIVFRGLQNRTPASEVAKEINEAVQLGRKRSLRIAMDQTAKLSASLDRQRQLQLGMTSFEWRHSRKEHYRPHHKARDGKSFNWSSEVGRNDPPGQAVFCGCKAKGILEL